MATSRHTARAPHTPQKLHLRQPMGRPRTRRHRKLDHRRPDDSRKRTQATHQQPHPAHGQNHRRTLPRHSTRKRTLHKRQPAVHRRQQPPRTRCTHARRIPHIRMRHTTHRHAPAIITTHHRQHITIRLLRQPPPRPTRKRHRTDRRGPHTLTPGNPTPVQPPPTRYAHARSPAYTKT